MVIRQLLCTLCVIVFAHVAAASDQSLEARVDRSLIAETETLTFKLIQRGGDEEPDVSALLVDFDVLATSRSSQMSIVNGTVDSYAIWQYTLAPLRSGDLVIPSIESGSARSDPLTVRVTPQNVGSSNGGAPPEIFLEADVENTSPYVQSQVIYSVKIFRSRNFFDGSLSEPKSDDLIYQRLGEDTSYRLERDGIWYTVLQRRYVLFPQKSGRVVVPAIVLGATVPASNAGQGSFSGLLAHKRPIRVRSNEVVLDVQPPPETYTAQWWLPAKSVALEESWPSNGDDIRVGTPITRTLRISAEGILRGQLPKLTSPDVPDVKIYSDQPELEDKTTLDGLSGKHTERWAIIAQAAGTHTLPPIELAWWDVHEDRQKVERLPARTITVLPAIGEQSTSDSAATVQNSSDTQTQKTDGAVEHEASGVQTDDTRLWIAVSAFLLLAWVATTVVLLIKLGQKDALNDNSGKAAQNSRTALVRVKNAVSVNDPESIHLAVINWALAIWPENPPRNLVSVAARIKSPDLRDYLRVLDATLYSKTEGQQASLASDELPAWLKNEESRIERNQVISEEPLPRF
ncbi:MAG: BatD family protein [Pseudomonadota bacterium]